MFGRIIADTLDHIIIRLRWLFVQPLRYFKGVENPEYPVVTFRLFDYG